MELGPAPTSFLDPERGEPRFGAYAGSLPNVTLAAGLAANVVRRKRWVYLAFAGDDAWIAVAVVRTGYAATAFGFAWDLRERTMLADVTRLAPAFAAEVSDAPHEDGVVARFGRAVRVTRSGSRLDVRVALGPLSVEASLDERGAPPGITAIARVGAAGSGLVNATEKRALLATSGRARAGSGRLLRLDGGTGGYDYTHGLMPRHTTWRWGFGLGVDTTGRPFGFNVVQGFVGAAECALWTATGVVALPEPRFTFDGARAEQPWRIASEDGAIDLRFTPGAVHAQRTNLGLVRSRFVQPVGTFEGTVRAGGHEAHVERLLGVVEDQDVWW
jgi:Domain of unknown function (DUF2804), C-terminal/Domain of unknown function (DUF2804), N-terminal